MLSSDLLFDQEFLRKLEYLHILSKKVAAGSFHAERTARRRGAGLEFADHRAYSPGDDFRHIDWRAYQRLGRLMLRLFEEEQGLPVYLFVDSSRSMGLGTPQKLQHARQVAAALCYIGLSHLDRISLMSYSDRLGPELRAQGGKGQVFRVLEYLSALEPSGTTDGGRALRRFVEKRRARGVAVVISDFFDPHGADRALEALRPGRHDVFAVHVTSHSDAHPDVRGDLRLVDAETGDLLTVAVTPGLLAAYAETFELHAAAVARYCDRHGFGYLRTTTDRPFEDAILDVFRQGRFLA